MNTLPCPLCKSGQLERIKGEKRFGSATPERIRCDKCDALFVEDDGKWKLLESHYDSPPSWWTHRSLSFTLDEWKQVADGAPLRYDAKVGRYVPYTPDEYSEYKLGPSDVAPPFLNARGPQEDGGTRSDSSSQRDNSGGIDVEPMPDKALEKQPVVTDTRLSKDDIASDYQMTDAGEFFLNMSFAELLQTHHMLKSFQEGVKLTADQLKSLEEIGFIE